MQKAQEQSFFKAQDVDMGRLGTVDAADEAWDAELGAGAQLR